jgi:hypothetical protein
MNERTWEYQALFFMIKTVLAIDDCGGQDGFQR